MHEYGIAQSIADYMLAEAHRRKAEGVSEVRVEVAELTMVDTKVLSHALRLLMKGEVLAGCRVKVAKARSSFVCRKCSSRWTMAEAAKQIGAIPEALKVREPDSTEAPMHFIPSLAPAFVRCPKCGSADVEIEGGENVRIAGMSFR